MGFGCESCWRNEIKAFSTKAEWENLDLQITKLLSSNRLLRIPGALAEGNAEIEILRCSNCNTEWKLSIPNRFQRGFLKRV